MRQNQNSRRSRRERPRREAMPEESLADWEPKTTLGKAVANNKVTTLDEVLDSGKQILETQIVDHFIPDLEKELLLIGQAKGKFGGGKRRVFKQTQKKTKEGNKPRFATLAVVGNRNGIVGIGYGKSKETVPAREKAFRNAKLNVFKIRRGCGSWECMCGEPHSLPFAVEGKSGSVKIKLIPAPKGTGLCIEKECAKILELAGIKDVWSKTDGQTRTKINLIKACEEAMRNLIYTKVSPEQAETLSVVEGMIVKETPETDEETVGPAIPEEGENDQEEFEIVPDDEEEN